MSSKRLFFALWPDNRQRDQLRDVINSVAKTVEGRAVDRRNWHVTLPFIGELDERQIPDMQELAAQVQVEPFRLVFDRLEYWARPKVACLAASAGRTAIVGAVIATTVHVDARTRYHPHLGHVDKVETHRVDGSTG